MGVKVALDTNAYADWIKGVRWQQEILNADEVHLSVTVLGELYYGFACGDRQGRTLRDLESFLAAPVVHVDLVNPAIAEYYGDLKKYLRRQGTPIPDNDVWIAAASIQQGCTLLTNDKHFERLPQVRSARRED